jgi:hypothetical protein
MFIAGLWLGLMPAILFKALIVRHGEIAPEVDPIV